MSSENSKPEWFQMAQADAFEPKPASKKVLKIMALATPLFVLGAGLVFAQSQNSPSAVATALPTSSVATAAPTTQKAAIAITKPGIKLPIGDGEND
jgi:hypothetical protein